MIQDIQLNSFVGACLKKRVSSHVFSSLFEQFNGKRKVTVEEISSLISQDQEYDPLLVIYLTSCAMAHSSTNLRLGVVLGSLPNAIDSNQYVLLNSLKNALVLRHNGNPHSPINVTELNEIKTSITSYVKRLLEKQPYNFELVESLAGLTNILLSQVTFDLSLTQDQSNVLLTLVNVLSQKDKGAAQELEFTLNKSLKRLSTIGTRQSVSGQSNQSAHSHFLKTNKLTKLIWINLAVQNWSTNSKNFLASFEQLIKIKTNQNVLNELLTISFESFAIISQNPESSPLFVQNWTLFLTKRVPLLILELELKNTESALMNAIGQIDPKVTKTIKQQTSNSSSATDDDIFSSFPSTVTDIRHTFLRSCIALHLLPQSAFATILKQDAGADNKALPENDDALDSNGEVIDIETRLLSTLVDINPEFIPLEDSGYLEFLDSIEYFEGTKQAELSNLMLAKLEDFIKAFDTSHLYRLSLGLGLKPKALHVILFHLSPSVFLKPIMNILDNWSSNSEDMNFQDSYSAFGCVFLLFLLIVKKYNISLKQLLQFKEDVAAKSFCIGYLSSLGTTKQIDESDSHQIELLSGWSTALFDSGGISDDLMRLSTVQECIQIFPIIFQQVFVGCKQNMYNIDTIKGGLEYFLQPFLLATVIGIFAWSENYFWKDSSDEVLISLIKALMFPMELSGESVHIHKIVLSIYGPNLHKLFSHISSKNPSLIDSSLLLSIKPTVEDGHSAGFFEINNSPTFTAFLKSEASDSLKRNEAHLSPINLFHYQFNTLLNFTQTTSISNFDFQLLSVLLKLLGANTVLGYFLSEIVEAQNLNSKSSQNLLELSTFLLTVYFIGSSPELKVKWLKALKTETINEQPEDLISHGYDFLSAVIKLKQQVSTNTSQQDEVITLFYDKLVENVETLLPLK